MASSEIPVSRYAEVIRLLRSRGFDFILIGGAFFDLVSKRGYIRGDIDLFALSPDPFFEEDVYRELASSQGFEVEQTWLGTPRLVHPDGFPIEFYQNLMEFEMPPRFLEDRVEKKLGGVSVSVLGVEHNILLKARAGLVEERHISELVALLGSGRLRYDKGRLRELLGEFEENWKVIERILEDKGIL